MVTGCLSVCSRVRKGGCDYGEVGQEAVELWVDDGFVVLALDAQHEVPELIPST